MSFGDFSIFVRNNHKSINKLMKIKHLFAGLLCLGFSLNMHAQLDESKWGGWYMYFFDGQAKDSNWGIQGDVQYRNWNAAGDLEQLLLRAGLTYSPDDWAAKFTLGYGNIQTGEFGESNATNSESRMYQEMLMPQQLGWRIFLKHRFRYEQRWVEGMDFRTRYRYALFVTVPLTSKKVEVNTLYLSFKRNRCEKPKSFKKIFSH